MIRIYIYTLSNFNIEPKPWISRNTYRFPGDSLGLSTFQNMWKPPAKSNNVDYTDSGAKMDNMDNMAYHRPHKLHVCFTPLTWVLTKTHHTRVEFLQEHCKYCSHRP